MMMKLLPVLLLVLLCPGALAEQQSPDSTQQTSRLEQFELQTASSNGIDIAFRDLGEPGSPAIVMVMGLGGSHRLWGDDLPFALMDAGYRVVLFDNRDVADSTSFEAHGNPTIWWELLKNFLGFEVSSVYDLGDMAKDTIGLMDALNLEKAHIAGASMGGMIAQIVAAQYPERVITLVSIMSTPGFGDHLPAPSQQANDQLQGLAKGESEAETTRRLRAMGLYPESMPRQIMAVLKSGDRQAEVATIKSPTLVIHGEQDTLIPIEHGEFTASIIEGARFVSFPEMAHNLPESVIAPVVDHMVRHMSREPEINHDVSRQSL